MDFVGPLPPNEGKRYLLTIVDRATTWFAAYPMKEATAESAINGLVQWTSNFGVPDTIVTDCGSHFENKLFHAFTTRLGIEKRKTTPYHPASNGMVERRHRTMKEALRARCEDAKRT